MIWLCGGFVLPVFMVLKYLCVNREVLKQNYIMKTEIKGQRDATVQLPSFLYIRVNNIRE